MGTASQSATYLVFHSNAIAVCMQYGICLDACNSESCVFKAPPAIPSHPCQGLAFINYFAGQLGDLSFPDSVQDLLIHCCIQSIPSSIDLLQDGCQRQSAWCMAW